MSKGPFIAAFDVATATGICDGIPGGVPRVFTWYLSDAGDVRAYKLCYFRNLLDHYFAAGDVRAVYYERPANIQAMMRLGATDDVIAFLRGSVGVLEACAVHNGVEIVESVPVQTVRQAITGQRTFPRVNGKSTAKTVMMQTARNMGVDVSTDHEADAFALWWYACAKHLPRIGAVA